MKRSSYAIAKLFSNLEFVLTVIISIILIVFLILSTFLDLFPFEQTIRIALAAVVSFFMLSSLVQHFNIIPTIENINRLQSVEQFDVIEDYEKYYLALLGSIERAKDSVKLIYITEYPPSRYGMSSIDYWDRISAITKKRKSIVIQRIASLDNKPKCDWICKNTKQMINNTGYSIKCFVPQNKIKPIGMEIIDQRDIFLFGPHGGNRGVHIRNRDLGSILSTYFDSIWDSLGENAFIKRHGEKNPDVDGRMKRIMQEIKDLSLDIE